MELTNSTDQRDLFSSQPNKIRKQILFPLINRCTDYNDAKNIILSVGLVSKKSYEQTNCIFFTTDVLNLLAKNFKHATETAAINLKTPGSMRYRDIGRKMLFLSIQYSTPYRQIKQLRKLLNKGADINFQTAAFNTTPLIKATANNNPHLVFNLMENGANVNAKSNGKYVREHLIIYENKELESYFQLLLQFLTKKLETQTNNETIYRQLYKNPFSTAIRNALEIDKYLEIKGGIINPHNINKVYTNLTTIYKKTPCAESIFYIITNEEYR